MRLAHAVGCGLACNNKAGDTVGPSVTSHAGVCMDGVRGFRAHRRPMGQYLCLSVLPLWLCGLCQQSGSPTRSMRWPFSSTLERTLCVWGGHSSFRASIPRVNGGEVSHTQSIHPSIHSPCPTAHRAAGLVEAHRLGLLEQPLPRLARPLLRLLAGRDLFEFKRAWVSKHAVVRPFEGAVAGRPRPIGWLNAQPPTHLLPGVVQVVPLEDPLLVVVLARAVVAGVGADEAVLGPHLVADGADVGPPPEGRLLDVERQHDVVRRVLLPIGVRTGAGVGKRVVLVVRGAGGACPPTLAEDKTMSYRRQMKKRVATYR